MYEKFDPDECLIKYLYGKWYSGDSSYFHEFSEFCDTGKSGGSGETGESCEFGDSGESCEFGDSGDSCKYGKTGVAGESDDPYNFGESSGFSECGDSGESGEFGECGDSRADGDSGDSGEYGDFVEYGETGDSAYSDEFDDSSEYGNSGDSCDCGVSGKSNKSGYLAHKYMMLCCSARNKHNLVDCVGFLVILICECINFNLRGMKVVF